MAESRQRDDVDTLTVVGKLESRWILRGSDSHE